MLCVLCIHLISEIGSFAEEDIIRNAGLTSSATGTANASRGLEVAVANLQDYCNGRFPSLLFNELFLFHNQQVYEHKPLISHFYTWNVRILPV